jgi:membrane protease YdiL (CAAX protease family)
MKKEQLSLVSIYLLWLFIVSPLTVALFSPIIKNGGTNIALIGILLAPLTYLLTFYLYKFIFKSKYTLKNLFTEPQINSHYITKGILTAIIVLIVTFSFNILYFTIFKDFINNNRADNVNGLLSIPFSLTILTGGIIIPFIEEIVFRKSIREIIPNSKPITYIITSALIFSSVHIQNTENLYNMMFYVIGTFIDGLIFAYIYEKEKTVWPSYIGHALYNTFILILQVL